MVVQVAERSGQTLYFLDLISRHPCCAQESVIYSHLLLLRDENKNSDDEALLNAAREIRKELQQKDVNLHAEVEQIFDDLLLFVNRLAPFNTECFVTLGTIPEENLIVTYSGHQFDCKELILYNKTRQINKDLGEQKDMRLLLNPYTRQPFDPKDVQRIFECTRHCCPQLSISGLCANITSLKDNIVKDSVSNRNRLFEDDSSPPSRYDQILDGFEAYLWNKLGGSITIAVFFLVAMVLFKEGVKQIEPQTPCMP